MGRTVKGAVFFQSSSEAGERITEYESDMAGHHEIKYARVPVRIDNRDYAVKFKVLQTRLMLPSGARLFWQPRDLQECHGLEGSLRYVRKRVGAHWELWRAFFRSATLECTQNMVTSRAARERRAHAHADVDGGRDVPVGLVFSEEWSLATTLFLALIARLGATLSPPVCD